MIFSMLQKLETFSSIQAIKKAISSEKSLLFEELWDAPKAILSLLLLSHTNKNVLIITGGERETRLYDDLTFFSGLVLQNFRRFNLVSSTLKTGCTGNIRIAIDGVVTLAIFQISRYPISIDLVPKSGKYCRIFQIEFKALFFGSPSCL